MNYPLRQKLKAVAAFFVFTAAICWTLGAIFVREHSRAMKLKKFPVLRGEVVERYMTNYYGILERPFLIIQADGTNLVVGALLSQNKIYEMPNRVSFHFSGDPTQEVQVVGERDLKQQAIWIFALPVVGSALLGLAVWAGSKQGGGSSEPPPHIHLHPEGTG